MEVEVEVEVEARTGKGKEWGIGGSRPRKRVGGQLLAEALSVFCGFFDKIGEERETGLTAMWSGRKRQARYAFAPELWKKLQVRDASSSGRITAGAWVATLGLDKRLRQPPPVPSLPTLEAQGTQCLQVPTQVPT